MPEFIKNAKAMIGEIPTKVIAAQDSGKRFLSNWLSNLEQLEYENVSAKSMSFFVARIIACLLVRLFTLILKVM